MDRTFECCDCSTIDMGLYNSGELVLKLTETLEAYHLNDESKARTQEVRDLLEELAAIEDQDVTIVGSEQRQFEIRDTLDEIYLDATTRPDVEILYDSQTIIVHESDCDWAERDYSSWHETQDNGEVPGHFAKWSSEGHWGVFGGAFSWECEEPGCRMYSLDPPTSLDY